MQKNNDWVNALHMILCALVPLSVFFLSYRTAGFSYNVAAVICVVTGIASMVALLPLTGLIYFGIVKLSRGKSSDNEVTVHSTDSGCSSLIFVVLFLIMFPVFEKARKNAMKHRKQNSIHQQAKPMN